MTTIDSLFHQFERITAAVPPPEEPHYLELSDEEQTITDSIWYRHYRGEGDTWDSILRDHRLSEDELNALYKIMDAHVGGRR